MNADRNLLFGILAFQNNFIDRQALLAAFDRWTTNKNRPLGEILVELGNLDVPRCQLLDALVVEHLKQHGGDAEKSLAAVSSAGSVRADLERIADPDVEASLGHMSVVPDNDPRVASTVSAGTKSSSGLRFTILRPHAKGGLGQVSVALDEELNREVAFKEIQDSHADDAVSRSRFLLEAEVTGGLEHPGIVPVYGLGKYGNGRPFYAMRFVKGDSLQTAIKRFQEADQSNRDPGQRSLELRKLLGRLIDVCNAIEYAHSRRVLHRDLKPGNIMLGKYGETLVVDWGLAKLLSRRDSSAESDEPTLRPASASGSGFTQLGSAIGTPQYMSPEQAAGRIDELGPTTDVYSIGATLYCLLTGLSPFPDSDDLETAARVCTGDFVPPRRVNPEVPAALQAICLKAMSLKPGDRYASARALADDLEHWLADEQVSVYRDRLSRYMARWVRNHKGTAGAAAAAVAVIIIGGIVAAAIGRRANERTRVQGLVDALVTSDPQQVPEILKQLGQCATWARPMLKEKLAQAKHGSTEKLHLSLALVESDEGQVEFLYSRLMRADAERFPVIRDALASYATRVNDRLWTVLAGHEDDPEQQRLRAAGALAKYDPRSTQWTEVAREVASQLVSVNPVFIAQWQESLRPVADKLLAPLANIFNDPGQSELPRTLATSLLADYAKDDPDALTNLVIDSDSKAFGTLFPLLQSHQTAAVEKLQAVLDRKVEPTWDDPPFDTAWSQPPTAARAAIEAAHGMLAEQFAFCQDLAWDEFPQLAQSLRPSGYRPTRVRPWGDGHKLLVAAVWSRDGKRWELETDLARDQLPEGDALAEKGGLVPADVAVVTSVAPLAELRFVLLWGEAATGEQRRLVVDASEQQLVASQAAMVKHGFAAQDAVGVWIETDGQRHYLGIWSNQGAPSESRAAYGGFELVDQPQWDVAVAPAAKLADPLDAFRQQLAEIAKFPPAQLEQPHVRLIRSKAQYHLGQLEGALVDLDFLVEKKVVSPELLQYRTWTLARLGKSQEARSELAKYLEQANDPTLRAVVEIVLAAWLGEYDQVTELLNSATTAAANADGLYNAACAAALASQACSASDAERAARFLGRAIKLVEAAVAQGYQNTGALRSDVDLAVLHGDSRFLEILDRLEPPARYAAVWRADVEFESRLVGPTSPKSQLEKARELAAQGYRPVSTCVWGQAAFEKGSQADSVVSIVWHRPLVPDAAKEKLAERQATAAAALLRMGIAVRQWSLLTHQHVPWLSERQVVVVGMGAEEKVLLHKDVAERVWPLFEHRPDPRLRSFLLDRLAPCGVEPATVLTQLQTESDVSRRRALILAIGQFARAKLLSSVQQSAVVSNLAHWYADDLDPGIHGAAEWTLRQLGAQTEIAQVRQAYATGHVVGERQWYLTKEGVQTLVIARPDEEFLMGSPAAEPERFAGPTGKNELRHRRRIGRTFAIGAHEVTVEQFQRFRADHEFERTKAREPDAPANNVSWYDTAAFCNWLSEREGIPREQWCYNPNQEFAEGMELYPDHLHRTGYRLPSEAEWEYACRAGATTARYFGETDRLLGEYAWYTKNSQDRWMLPVGNLKPNDWGLFDTYGNALEWCQDVPLFYLKDRAWLEDKEQSGIVSNSQFRVSRGGPFFDFAAGVRSAARSATRPEIRTYSYGFRVARTCP